MLRDICADFVTPYAVESALFPILLPVPERAQLRQQHVVWRRVLRVILEHRPLEVLHRVWLAVEVAHLGELVGDWVALLEQAAVLLPVLEEPAAQPLARFGDERRAWACVRLLAGSAVRVFLPILK